MIIVFVPHMYCNDSFRLYQGPGLLFAFPDCRFTHWRIYICPASGQGPRTINFFLNHEYFIILEYGGSDIDFRSLVPCFRGKQFPYFFMVCFCILMQYLNYNISYFFIPLAVVIIFAECQSRLCNWLQLRGPKQPFFIHELFRIYI